jgi:hypothetical protein
MACQEHVDILKTGRGVWNKWRADYKHLEPDLSGTKILAGARLTGFNLRDTDFERADFREARIDRTDLSGADLGGADLRHANFFGVSLVGANLAGATLRGAYIAATVFGSLHVNCPDSVADYDGGTILAGTDFTDAEMSVCSFSDTDFRDAIGLATVKHRSRSSIDTESIYASQGKIPDIFLRGCGVPESFITFHHSLVGQAVQLYSCFISYSHADKRFARRLHDALQGRGIRCWLDDKQLLPGDDIYEHVDRGIRLWDKVLLCCSKESLKPASWVDKEIIATLAKEDELTRRRGQKVRSLIPLNLDGYLFSNEWQSGYRAEIRRRMAADFTGWEQSNDKFEQEFERLVQALRADAAAREAPPESQL